MANTRTDALAVARSQKGVKESPPQSNNVLFSRWYKLRGPWCAMYLSWVLDQVGNRSGYRFASTAASVAWARRAGKLRPVKDARPGDIVVRLYTPSTGHTGMVAAVEGRTTVTLEGNTSPSNSRDGGEVMERRRSTGWWQYCIGIDYQPALTTHAATAATMKESDDMFSEADRALLAALRTTQGEDRARLDRTVTLLELSERRALRMVADEKDGSVWLIVPGILRAPVAAGAVDVYRHELGFTDVPKWGHETLMAIPTAGRPA